jgi:hypothetical protein
MIVLYQIGFDRLEDFPKDVIESINKSRDDEITNMMETQFILSYLGNISKKDSDDMTPFELTNWYNFLKKQKDLENNRVQENITGKIPQ